MSEEIIRRDNDEAVEGAADGVEVEGYLLHPSQSVPAWYLRLPPVYQQLPITPPIPNPGPIYTRPA
ncbi:MAG TPA: hypothetical protein VFD32_20180 [Dehalococcoidia bacterium]|nr:hypothetical protein [Dehalococcoidia bacterium]